MFTFKTAMLFWLVAASVPLLTSLVYFRASPSTESLIQRIAVSLHGVAISALCVGAGVASAGGQRYRHDRRREHSGNSFQFHFKSILSFVLSFQSVEVSTKPLASKSILLYGS